MRTNLIMHFHCSECGSVLNILYPSDEKVKNENYDYTKHDREPTGATVRYTERVQVQPCRTCIDKYTGPARQLTQAIEALSAGSKAL